MSYHKLRVHLRCDGSHAFCGVSEIGRRNESLPLILTTVQSAVTCKRCAKRWGVNLAAECARREAEYLAGSPPPHEDPPKEM